MRELNALNGKLPRSVQEEVVVAPDADKHEDLLDTYLGEDRVGPANNKHFDPKEFRQSSRMCEDDEEEHEGTETCFE